MIKWNFLLAGGERAINKILIEFQTILHWMKTKVFAAIKEIYGSGLASVNLYEILSNLKE